MNDIGMRITRANDQGIAKTRTSFHQELATWLEENKFLRFKNDNRFDPLCFLKHEEWEKLCFKVFGLGKEYGLKHLYLVQMLSDLQTQMLEIGEGEALIQFLKTEPIFCTFDNRV